MDIFTLSIINLCIGSFLIILFSLKFNFTMGLSFKKEISLVGFCLFLHSFIVVLNEAYTLPFIVFPSLVNALVVYSEVCFVILYRRIFGCTTWLWLHSVPILLFLILNFEVFADNKNNRILLSVFLSLVVYSGVVASIGKENAAGFRSLMFFARFIFSFSTIQMLSLALYVVFNEYVNEGLGVRSLYLELGVFGFTIYSLLISTFCVLYLFQYRYNKIKKLAEHDSLTELLNRQTLNKRMAHELNKAGRYNYSVCVIMVDIYFFKKIRKSVV